MSQNITKHIIRSCITLILTGIVGWGIKYLMDKLNQGFSITPLFVILLILSVLILWSILNLNKEIISGFLLNQKWHQYWFIQDILNNIENQKKDKIFYSISIIDFLINKKRHNALKILEDKMDSNCQKPVRVIIIGEPGSGKTTLLKQLNYSIAETNKYPWKLKYIPIHINMGEIQGNPIEKLIEIEMEKISKKHGAILKFSTKNLLESGKIILLLDAFDEALKDLDNIKRNLNDFLTNTTYLKIPLIITSRKREASELSIEKFEIYEIQELSDESVNTFISIYNTNNKPSDEIIHQLFNFNLLDAGAIGRNPYWLSLIIQSEIFEGSKGSLLNKTIDEFLIREWEKQETKRCWEKHINLHHDQLRVTKEGLAWLAFKMTQMNKSIDTREEAYEIIQPWLDSYQDYAKVLTFKDIIGLGRDAQILRYYPQRDLTLGLLSYDKYIEFSHRLVQEFFTSWVYANSDIYNFTSEKPTLTDEVLDQLIHTSSNWQILLMLGDLIDNKTTYVERVFNKSEDKYRILIAAALLKLIYLNKEHEPIITQISSKLSIILKKDTSGEIEKDILDFATIDNECITQALVIAFADDPSIENQQAGEKIIQLLGKIKNINSFDFLITIFEIPHFKKSVSTAIEEVGEPIVESLIAHFSDEDESVRVGAQEEVVKIGTPSINHLISYIWVKNEKVRIGAIKSLINIGTPAVEPLLLLLKDENWVKRIEAAIILSKIKDNSAAIDSLVTLLQDKMWAVRLSAIESLNKIGEPKSVKIAKYALSIIDNDIFHRNVDAHYYYANILAEMGEDEIAETHLKKVIELNPRDARAYFYLCGVLEGKGREDEIISLSKKANKLAPYTSSGQFGTAYHLEKQGKIDEAESYYIKSLKLNPNSETTHHSYAKFLLKKGKTEGMEVHKDWKDTILRLFHLNKNGNDDDAEKHFIKALELNPTQIEYYFDYAEFLEEKGELESAEEQIKKALELDLNSAFGHYYYAKLLDKRENNDDAEKHFIKAIELNPTQIIFYISYSAHLDKIGKLDNAEEQLQKALKLDPNSAFCHCGYAILLDEKGNVDEAKKFFIKALELDPDGEYIRERYNIFLEKHKQIS